MTSAEGFNPSDVAADEDGYVSFNPDAEKRSYLQQAGLYGPNLAHPAECSVIGYEMPSTENPGYDKQGASGPYAMLNIKVVSKEFGLCFVRHFEPIGSFGGSRCPRWLKNLGVPLGPAPEYRHRPSDVVGRPCAIEIGDPNPGRDGRVFSGRLMDILGA